MWWYRIALFAVLMGAVSGCGFRPLYGDYSGARVQPELETIFVDTIADRHGQILRNELLTLITPRGGRATAKFRLTTTITENESQQLQRTDETATRADYRLLASFQLKRIDDDKTILSGQSVSLASYDLVDAEYGRIVARENAVTRAAQEIAQDIKSRLSTYFLNPPRKIHEKN